MNPTAIEAHVKLVLLQWMIIIAVAWIFGRLGKKIGQPLAVGEILAGLLLGPSALGLIWPHDWPVLFPTETQQSLQLLGKIGLIFLLFQVGMEFDFGHLRVKSKTVFAVSFMGILAPAIGGLCMAPWLHNRFAQDVPLFGFELFVCIALSISALPIMGRILLEMRLERTAMGALAVGSAAIDDVLGWVGLAVVTALATSKFAWGAVAVQLGGVLVWLLVLHFVVGPALKWFWKKSCAQRDPQDTARMTSSFMAVMLMTLFTSCLVTNRLGVFSIFGAFLLGTALHQQTDLVRAWREQLSNFVLVALVPIFFTNTGLRTRIDSLQTSTAWLACALVLVVGTVGKLGGCWFGARVSGQANRDSLSIAALMNTRALMGLVAINVGADLGLLPKELFTMFVIMSLLTTAMTGPLLKLWLPDEIRSLVPEYARRARRAPKEELSNVS